VAPATFTDSVYIGAAIMDVKKEAAILGVDSYGLDTEVVNGTPMVVWKTAHLAGRAGVGVRNNLAAATRHPHIGPLPFVIPVGSDSAANYSYLFADALCKPGGACLNRGTYFVGKHKWNPPADFTPTNIWQGLGVGGGQWEDTNKTLYTVEQALQQSKGRDTWWWVPRDRMFMVIDALALMGEQR
jgi:hypothetical protein